MQLKDLIARKILNSRGEEAIEVIAETRKGKAFSAAPSGKSRGKYEAEQYSEKGINASCIFINFLGKILTQQKTSFEKFEDLEKFEDIARKYDRTEEWKIIGGNAIFAAEAAILKAMALDEGKELWQFLNPKPKMLPLPLGNCVGGGEHIKSEKKADFQEFLLIPQAAHFLDAYFINLQAYKEAKKLFFYNDLGWKGHLTSESAIASTLETEKIFQLLNQLRENIKSRFNVNMQLGTDIAASTFYKNNKYSCKNPPAERSKEEQLKYISSLIKENNLFYIEDPFDEEDFDSFSDLLKENKKSLICGDDLICTKQDRLEKAIKQNSINAVIIKPNQNGSLLHTKRVVDLAKQKGITPIISHRSGETMDTTISDLAVGWQIPLIKTGILGKERLAKLHRLIKIERQLSRK